ncbi:hypothetical protein [Microcoleus anatoxicus]|uniref:hypothetical protein n=1 Tax=Microcoleus anatoxicus TaxID=2705319 RepID=UPI0029747854|nr:MAG: hypothetical protein EAZ96_19815 [Oscillatoriales cyanobacterium]
MHAHLINFTIEIIEQLTVDFCSTLSVVEGSVVCYSSRQGALVIEPFDCVYPEPFDYAQGTMT